jgi:hypothetical protein
VDVDGQEGRQQVGRLKYRVDKVEHSWMLHQRRDGRGLGEEGIHPLGPKALEVVATHQVAA